MSREAENDLAVRAAWLSHVGGYTQEQIAQRLGVSRIKVHRLSSLAHDLGFVNVSIEHDLESVIALEDKFAAAFGLESCTLVPAMDVATDSPESALTAALGTAAARFLRLFLDREADATIGVGWGQTLAVAAEKLPRRQQADHSFVALLGSPTSYGATYSYEVIHSLVVKTGGSGFLMPVPLMADNPGDREILMGQQSIREILAMAGSADLFMVGIGDCTPGSSHIRSGQLGKTELDELLAAGAVGELLGRYFDASGKLVPSPVNDRVLGIDLRMLKNRQVIAVAGGARKQNAIAGAIKTGLIRRLITDEVTARNLLAAGG